MRPRTFLQGLRLGFGPHVDLRLGGKLLAVDPGPVQAGAVNDLVALARLHLDALPFLGVQRVGLLVAPALQRLQRLLDRGRLAQSAVAQRPVLLLGACRRRLRARGSRRGARQGDIGGIRALLTRVGGDGVLLSGRTAAAFALVGLDKHVAIRLRRRGPARVRVSRKGSGWGGSGRTWQVRRCELPGPDCSHTSDSLARPLICILQSLSRKTLVWICGSALTPAHAASATVTASADLIATAGARSRARKIAMLRAKQLVD